MVTLERKLLSWFFNGDVGLSSKAIASACLDIKTDDHTYHPCDTGDLRRCIALLDAVPELRPLLPKVATLSPVWSALIANWDKLEATFRQEQGTCTSVYKRLPDTSAVLKLLISEAEQAA